jgi:hypothetical protein
LKSLVLAAALAVTLHSDAAAQLNLSWDECGSSGTGLSTFACNVGYGPTRNLVASFKAPFGINELVLFRSKMVFTFDGEVPEWWQFAAGQCRSTDWDFQYDGSLGFPKGCTGSIPASRTWSWSTPAPGKLELNVDAVVRGEPVYLYPHLEYFAYEVRISNLHTTGNGACAGCSMKACIRHDEVQLIQTPSQTFDRTLRGPLDRQIVYWQEAWKCEVDAVRSTTWGTVKALYR